MDISKHMDNFSIIKPILMKIYVNPLTPFGHYCLLTLPFINSKQKTALEQLIEDYYGSTDIICTYYLVYLPVTESPLPKIWTELNTTELDEFYRQNFKMTVPPVNIETGSWQKQWWAIEQWRKSKGAHTRSV